MEDIEFKVLKSFLVDAKSHRWIQENILGVEAPLRGGGYETMKILHSYGIRGDVKGALAEYDLTSNNIMSLLLELKSTSQEIEENVTYIEGATKAHLISSFERDANVRKKCISYYGCVCQACGFDFYNKYGEAAQGYIEVHHKLPLSTLRSNYVVDPINDLVPLCSNCHSVVHRKIPPYTVKELKIMITHQKGLKLD